MANGIKIREIRILQIFFDIVNSLWYYDKECSKSANLSSEFNSIAALGLFDLF